MDTVTPDSTLTELINNFGWTEWTVEAFDGERLPTNSHDLGNGYCAYGFVSDTLDSFYVNDGLQVSDAMSTFFSDWINLSSLYTGQHGAPDTLHDSEYFAGRMAEFAANTPGEYTIPVVYWEEVDTEGETADSSIEGWVFLHREI